MSLGGIPRGSAQPTDAESNSAPRTSGSFPSQHLSTASITTTQSNDASTFARESAPRRPAKSSTSRKRSVSDARISYPRKRAATACQVCRLRKTKCDNERPVCGTCHVLNVKCVYPDKASNHTLFDPGSLAILERVDYAIHLLEGHRNHATYFGNHAAVAQQSNDILTPSVSNTSASNTSAVDDAATLVEALEVSDGCSSNRILTWPIFESKVDAARINAYFFEPYKSLSLELSLSPSSLHIRPDQSCRTYHGGSGISEEDVPIFIQEFLEKVHIKNPILDPPALVEMARGVAEEGFRWDGSSCLILIACALANLASDFSLTKPDANKPSYLDAKDYATAEQYYTASCKRIGLLENSVLAAQCSFLIGVYEMYSLRPLKAWLSFSSACTKFQTYLRFSSRSSLSHSAKRLEQRLYWSCLKSECEMREEIDLPSSGLAKVDSPDVLPSPPGDTPEPEDLRTAGMTAHLEEAFQRSWYYYLSEIACRRISNRISNTLHKELPEAWLTIPSKRLHRLAEELDAQAMQWIEHVPNSLEGSPYHYPPDELQWLLKVRFVDLRERIWRPFLFIVIHTERHEAEDSENLKHAAVSLSHAFQYIDMLTNHRHHGSWYAARRCFTKALLILAAAKSGRIALREDWVSYIEFAQNQLMYWEEESPDLHMARSTLSTILADIDVRYVQCSSGTVEKTP